MKKIVSLFASVLLGIGAVISIPIFTTAETTVSEYPYTVQDLQNLQNHLLAIPPEKDLAGKPYDLDDNDKWDTFDFVLMRQSVMNQENAEMKINIEVNGHTLTAELADNAAAQALAELLKDEPIVLDLNEYGSFEKVGVLPQSLPKDDERITTKPGDIMLYQGNQITIFYGTNTWSYTRLGHINIAQDELKAILGENDVKVTLSMIE